MIRIGIAKGKYKNPFMTIVTNKRTLVFEIHTCLSSLTTLRKFTDGNSPNFFHLCISFLTITNFPKE